MPAAFWQQAYLLYKQAYSDYNWERILEWRKQDGNEKGEKNGERILHGSSVDSAQNFHSAGCADRNQ